MSSQTQNRSTAVHDVVTGRPKVVSKHTENCQPRRSIRINKCSLESKTAEPVKTGTPSRLPLSAIQNIGTVACNNDMGKTSAADSKPGSSKKTLNNVLISKSKPKKPSTVEIIVKKDGNGAQKNEKKVSKSGGTGSSNILDKLKKVYQTKPSATETTSNDISLVTGTEPPESYYRLLAEERRLALQETLSENEILVTENTRLKDEVESLKAQNEVLLNCVDLAKFNEMVEMANLETVDSA